MNKNFLYVDNKTSLFLELSLQRAKTGRNGPSRTKVAHMPGRAWPGRKMSVRLHLYFCTCGQNLEEYNKNGGSVGEAP